MHRIARWAAEGSMMIADIRVRIGEIDEQITELLAALDDETPLGVCTDADDAFRLGWVLAADSSRVLAQSAIAVLTFGSAGPAGLEARVRELLGRSSRSDEHPCRMLAACRGRLRDLDLLIGELADALAAYGRHGNAPALTDQDLHALLG